MNPSSLRRPYLFLILISCALCLPLFASAQEGPPPLIPHPVENYPPCLVCHETGVGQAPKFPEGHDGYGNEICQGCHQISDNEVTATPAPAEESTATVTPTAVDESTATATPTAIDESTATAMPTAVEESTATVTPTAVDVSTATATPTAAIASTATPLKLNEGGPSLIPHTLIGREDCLACHETGVGGATTIPEDHAGRPNSVCQGCHQDAEGKADVSQEAADESGPSPIPHTLEDRENCTECHAVSASADIETGGIPQIPHTLIGREICLACHETGVGGATAIPENHAGRPNDACQGCHQSSRSDVAATPDVPDLPVPTPLAYPRTEGVDNCVECHATLADKHTQVTDAWQLSVHAEREVICADCHGGDPSADTIDAAMSPAAGYIGVPDKQDIPALCAGCHADVTLMRQYDLPTDQYAKYSESVHGIRLAEGDDNVTTCFDCHGGHQILKANDPSSTVYQANVPALCAGCHSDPVLMAPYDIPIDQFDLYRQSVHGHALLDNHDFRAPNCATCHGTHGAAPPGYEEVANICGSCHGATQDHFLESPHANAENGPKCVTCHGRYDVSKPNEDLYLSTEPRHCGSCHPDGSEPAEVAQSMYDAITHAATSIEEAESAIASARELGMLVTFQENQLREANTSLITARAAQHTLDMDSLSELTERSAVQSDEARQGAEAAIDESVFRRKAMVIAVIAITIVIVALYLLKRQLDAKLEANDE